MNQIALKREDMTYEEFIILSARLVSGDRKFIINPMDSLFAKFELKKIKTNIDFLEFCVSNFLQMHHHISKDELLKEINTQLNKPKDLPFGLYDLLIQKFFIECQSKPPDITASQIYQIQAKIFFILYDQEFWMQIFTIEDCDTYIFKYPKVQIIGFLKSLVDQINRFKKDDKDEIIRKMNCDGIFDIIIKYLYGQSLSDCKDSIHTLIKFAEILDISIISQKLNVDVFLNGVREGSINSIKILSAMFQNSDQDISDEKKLGIINFIEKTHFFESFAEYINHQKGKENLINDDSLLQFLTLICNIFSPLIPRNPSNFNYNENGFLLQVINKFCPIFFQILIPIDAIPEKTINDYSNFISNLLLLLPDKTGDLLKTLFEKLNTLLTNSPTDYQSVVNMTNYLKLFLNIQSSSTNYNRENSNAILPQIFSLLGTGPDKPDRTELFLEVLSRILNLDVYFTSDVIVINFDEDDFSQEVEQFRNYSKFDANLLQAIVSYYEFIISDDFLREFSGQELTIKLIKLYSIFTFECAETFENVQYDNQIIRLFLIAINQMIVFKEIVYHCVEKFPKIIAKLDNINSIALNLMVSANHILTCSGLKIAGILNQKALTLTDEQREDIIIEAIQKVMQNNVPSFHDISPLFLSTSVDSINSNRTNFDQQVFVPIYNYLIAARNQIPKGHPDMDDWLASFIHFFGLKFYSDIKVMFEEIQQSIEISKEKGDPNIDFEKITIITRELKNLFPLREENPELNEQLDIVIKILTSSADICMRTIVEYYQDEGDKIFRDSCYNDYDNDDNEFPLPENVREAIYFANEAVEFFIPLFIYIPLFETYKILLPFFKMCCSIPIIKKEEVLFSIFQFVLKNDQNSIDDFLQCSLKMYLLIRNNKKYLPNLLSLAEFHLLLVKTDKKKFIESLRCNISNNYLDALFGFADGDTPNPFKQRISELCFKMKL